MQARPETARASQDNSSCMLPTEILVKVLQHVPQQTRLIACALVCRSWRTAAYSATSSLTTRLQQQYQQDSLGLWLQQYGTNLEALNITGSFSMRPITLCSEHLPQLKSLELKHLMLREFHKAMCNSAASSLSQLTQLQLCHVDVYPDGADPALTQLPNLRHLQLSHVYTDGSKWVEDSMQQGLGSWAQLTTLVYEPNASDSGGRVWGGLGNLTQLEQLSTYVLEANTLMLLPYSLTHLRFQVDEQLDQSTAPRLSELTGLRHLSVKFIGDASIDPQLLSSLLQLQHLQLTWHLCPASNNACAAAWLAVLSRLQQLQHLSLVNLQTPINGVENVGQCTAMVSSTQLTLLDLTDSSMPANAVYHMFEAERQCPALKTFRIGSRALNDADLTTATYSVADGALERLVVCCSGLQELHLRDLSLKDSQEITKLAQLTALSELLLATGGVSDASIRTLGTLKLPALRNLSVYPGGLGFSVTAQGVWDLRVMTQLTKLYIYVGDADSVDDEAWRAKFVNEAGLSKLSEQMYTKLKDNKDMAEVLSHAVDEGQQMLTWRAEAAEHPVRRLQQQEHTLGPESIQQLQLAQQKGGLR